MCETAAEVYGAMMKWLLVPILVLLLTATAWATLPATDSFTRADGAVGSNWTKYSTGNWQVKSNLVTNTTDDGGYVYDFMKWNADTFTNDQYAEVKIVNMTTAVSKWFGPAVRLNTTNGTGYACIPYGSGMKIMKMNADGGTSLGFNNYTPVANDVVRLQVVGSTLTCKVNGTTIVTVTNTSFTSGSPGIAQLYNSATGIASNFVADNVGGTLYNPSTQPSQSIALSDSVTASVIHTYSVPASDAVSTSESISYTSVRRVVRTDSASVSDSVSQPTVTGLPAGTFNAGIYGGGGYGGGTPNVPIADSVGASATVSVFKNLLGVGFGVSASDVVAVADTLTVISPRRVAIFDTVDVFDFLTRADAAQGGITTAVGISDTVCVTKNGVCGVSTRVTVNWIF